MSWHVYVLINPKGRRYVGWTGRSPEQRLGEHNAGLNSWTRANGPWRLLYFETFDTKQAALRRERYLKTGASRRLLDELAGSSRVDEGSDQSG